MVRSTPPPEGWVLPADWAGSPAAHVLLPLLLNVIASIKAHAADQPGDFCSLIGLNSLKCAQSALDGLRGHVHVFGEEGSRAAGVEPGQGRTAEPTA